MTIRVTSFENPEKATLKGITLNIPIKIAELKAVIAKGILPHTKDTIVKNNIIMAIVDVFKLITQMSYF
ncbi:hypothetical protein HMPREF3189_01607 [Clostridiales bacterium KA00134]|nr:hypothetical protein HMPREF3189_01607 [Clostridiales bacterium KA00134]